MTSGKRTAGRYHVLPQQLADDYDVSPEVLGEGITGEVKKAWRKDRHDQAFAVKALPLHGLPVHKIENFWAEVDVHLSLDHPHIVRLADVYETGNELHLVTECMEGGDVHDRWVQEMYTFSEPDAAQTLWQMLLVVSYLHEHNIAHRDIKFGNFLYDRPGSNTIKAIDFGVARKLEKGSKFDTWVGTMGFAAPEVLKKSYGMECDMFSLGVCAFNLLVGYSPFAHEPDRETLKKHLNGEYIEKPGMWDTISSQAKDFITSLLQVDPERRLGVHNALLHPWLLSHRPGAAQSLYIEGVPDALYNFRLCSSFRRHCLEMMAWSVSAAELEKAREVFLHINVGNNGSISLSELRAFMMRNKGSVRDNEMQETFAALDLDGNSTIQYSEFLAALLFTKITPHDGSLLAAFQRFDQEKTGEISFDSMKRTLQAWHQVKEQELGPSLSDCVSLSEILVKEAALNTVAEKYGHRPEASEIEILTMNDALPQMVLSFECFCSYISEPPAEAPASKKKNKKTFSICSMLSLYLRASHLSRPSKNGSMVKRCLYCLHGR